MNKQYQFFKYKGKKYFLSEVGFSKELPGVRVPNNGVNIIMVNKNLDKHKKMSVVHRLITGKGLNLFKYGKRAGRVA